MAEYQNLQKAKAALILDQPFFASLLLGMEIVENAACKTMRTNGEIIEFNPEFIADKSVQELTFVLAHETLHCAFEHMYTRGNRDANKWNIAADYVINDILVNENVGTMIDGALFNPELVKQGNGTTHGVYAILPEPPKDDKKPDKGKKGKDKGKDKGNGKGKGKDKGEGNADGDGQGEGQDDQSQGEGYPGAGESGGAMDEVIDAAQDEATNSQKASENRVRVVQAANAAKMAGKLSAGLARVVKEVTASRTDWKANLRRFFTERAKVDWSFARPKRRFLAEDIYLPSLAGERMGSTVIAIDCSGSVSATELELFSKETSAIIQDVCPEVTHVIYFDSEVLRIESFTKDDQFKINPIGGGGTRFSPVFKYIEKHNLNPNACVFLTDLVCADFGDAPSYPVMWVTTLATDAPFGEVLKFKE